MSKSLRIIKKILRIVCYTVLALILLIFLFYLLIVSLIKYTDITTIKDDATPLIAAIIEHDLDKMRSILDTGSAQIYNDCSMDGFALCYNYTVGGTALYYAVQNNNIEAAKLLIEYGVDVNWENYYEEGPTSIFGARAEMTQLLIDNGANPHREQGGWGFELSPFSKFELTPFAKAVCLLDIGTMDVLLGNGVDISFHKSMADDKLTDYPMVDTVLKGLASIPYYFSLYIYMPPLIKAIYEEDIEKVKELIEKGADVNIRFTRLNTTPLMVAAQKVNVPIMQLLIAHGADINARSKTGWNALFFAIVGARYDTNKNEMKAIQMLLDNDINVNAQNDSGLTPLMFAIKFGAYSYETPNPVEILLRYGADSIVKDINGKTVIMYCAIRNYESDLKYIPLFQEKGVDINAKNNAGKTALDYAKAIKEEFGINDNMLVFLLKHGAKSGK